MGLLIVSLRQVDEDVSARRKKSRAEGAVDAVARVAVERLIVRITLQRVERPEGSTDASIGDRSSKGCEVCKMRIVPLLG